MMANKLAAIAAAVASAAFSGFPPGQLYAQVGNDNPTGPTGQFNGNVTTGCSYDPYTANATRSVTDLVIAGAVGEYPLAFTRTMNSRYIAGTPVIPNEFGLAGNWRHSYQWSVDQRTETTGVPPTRYDVNYPDGRRISFSSGGTRDPNYFRGPSGIRDRFRPTGTGGGVCYVRLPDGGEVKFLATVTISGQSRTYRYRLIEIDDPYGQPTTITYPTDPVTHLQDMRITDHSGRYLQIFYKHPSATEGNVSDTVVNYVQGSDSRRVTYYYLKYTTANGTIYTTLKWVRYFGDITLDATYWYQANNVSPNDRPLILACIDPMFDGPMWEIRYVFHPAGTNQDGSTVVAGQLLSERDVSVTPIVSTLQITGAHTRRETRGDNPTGSGNPTRTFTYTGYKLTSSTDFKGVSASQTYDSTTGYLASITDRRQNITRYQCERLRWNGDPGKIPNPQRR